jgi:hypothetical protein
LVRPSSVPCVISDKSDVFRPTNDDHVWLLLETLSESDIPFVSYLTSDSSKRY